MTELVARQTELDVQDVEDGRLRLVEPSIEVATPKPSVDRFLSSLAREHGAKSVGIILSGTGSDGSYGIQAIREARRYHHRAG